MVNIKKTKGIYIKLGKIYNILGLKAITKIYKNSQVKVEIKSSIKKTRRKEKTRSKNDISGKIYKDDIKTRLVFINTMNINLFFSKLINDKKDSIKANLKSDINVIEMIEFKNSKNLGFTNVN